MPIQLLLCVYCALISLVSSNILLADLLDNGPILASTIVIGSKLLIFLVMMH